MFISVRLDVAAAAESDTEATMNFVEMQMLLMLVLQRRSSRGINHIVILAAAEQVPLRTGSFDAARLPNAMTASDKGSLGLEVGEESQGDSKSTAAAHRTLLDLPYEILTQVAAQLRPRVHPSLFPHPKAHSLDVTTITIPSNAALVDLINFAYISRKCYIAALPAIYHSLVLNTNRQVWLLAQSLTQRYQTKTDDLERYNGLRMPRHLFLTNDGLKMANDQLADQAQWAPSLRTIFRGSCHRLESIVIGTRPDGASLSEFLDPEVRATPKRVTILNL